MFYLLISLSGAIILIVCAFFIQPKNELHFHLSGNLTSEKKTAREVLVKLDKYDLFHPQVEISESINDISEGIGSQAKWTFPDGKGYVIEEITQYTSDSICMILVEGDIPLTFARTCFTLKEISSSDTQLDIDMNFRMKGGYLGYTLAKIFFIQKLKDRMTAFTKALSIYLEKEREH